MKIISDIEYFSWKFATIILSIVMIIMLFRFLIKSPCDTIPEVMYDTITINDTLIVHDTIYRWKEIQIYEQCIEDLNNDSLNF